MIAGLSLDYFGFNAVRMLFWAAVVNGVLAPPLVVLVVLLTNDKKVMGTRTNPPLLNWLGWLTAALMTAAWLATPALAQAPKLPDGPVKIVAGFAAGGSGDILARLVAAQLEKSLARSIIVENKPGAGGTIAMAELARSTPDGHTIAFASQGTLVFNQAIYAKPGYDSIKDFATVGFVGGVSNVMIVPPASAAKSPVLKGDSGRMVRIELSESHC